MPELTMRSIALITGGSGGIGLACARAFACAREPFDVVIQYNQHAAKAGELVKEIQQTRKVLSAW